MERGHFAALDVTIIAGGIGAAAKATRVGVGTAEVAEKSTARLAAEGAYDAMAAVGKTAVGVSPIAFAYVAITRPQLIASAGGWIAEQIGADRSVGIFVVYWIGVFLVLQFLRPLIWCARVVWRPGFRFARYAYGTRTA